MARKRTLVVPTVAVSLRKWREAKGWSRREAAEHLGISRRTLESYEYGVRNPPSLKMLEKLWASRRPK